MERIDIPARETSRRSWRGARPGVAPAPGFTLIELMVTLAVAAVLVSLAAPSFRSMLIGNRTNGTASGFFSALNYARNTALSSNLDVKVCPLNTASPPSCGSNWSAGWVIYYPSSPASAALQSTSIATNGATLTSPPPSNVLSVTFKPRGTSVTDNGAPAYFKLCDVRGANFARSVRILPSGLVQTNMLIYPQTGAATAVWDGSALTCP